MKLNTLLPGLNFLGRPMKTWVNIFGQFVIMNMYLDLRQDSIDSGPLYTEYDFIVGKSIFKLEL